MIQNFLDAVEEDAFNSLMKGDGFPGYKIVRSHTQRRWNDVAKDMLFDLMGQEAFEVKLIGITQAAKKIDDAAMQLMTTRPEGKPTIASMDDRRADITPINIEDDFDKID